MQKVKLQKILTICSVASVLMMAGGGQASASFSIINNGTGFESLNNADAIVTNALGVINQNVQNICNAQDGFVATGGNLVLDNGGLGQILTGSADLTGGFANDVNTNALSQVGPWIFDPIVGNSTTGAFSLNDADLLVNQSIAALNNNLANLGNSIMVSGISGNNLVEFNGGAGSVGTGDLLGSLAVNNLANSNLLEVASALPGVGPLSAATNSFTGANSLNDADLLVNDAIGVRNTNVANIANNVFGLLSSGGNIISANGGCALCGLTNLLTGDAASQTLIKNQVNSNGTIVNDGFGAMQVAATNDTTGAFSANHANALVTQAVGVDNLNSAWIANNVETTALTGGNLISANIGGANLLTGNAANSVDILNGPVNTNATHITVGGAGLVAASNSLTGAGSVNDANAALIINVGVVNTNRANIHNNIDSVAATGGNVVTDNTSCLGGCGGGLTAVETGNAVNSTAIVNSVNTNETAIAVAPPVAVVAENSCTGAGSVNDANASVVTNVSVVNTNNATISNNVDSVSTTGGNVVSGNTGGAAVSTGGAALTVGVDNTGNSNVTAVGQ